MVVWVKIRIHSKFCDSFLETSAILNSGFGHPYPGAPSSPIVRLPYKLASKLCFSEEIIKQYARKEIYDTAGGPVELHLVPQGVIVELIGENRKIPCDVLIDRDADVVLLNDRAISSLGIIILDPAEGIWTLKEDMKPRESSEPEFW